MATVLLHENIVFEHETVHLVGHAYRNCTFRLCTIVYRGGPEAMVDGCRFEGCVWHLDLIVHDRGSWADLQKHLFDLIGSSLPEAPPSQLAQGETKAN